MRSQSASDQATGTLNETGVRTEPSRYDRAGLPLFIAQPRRGSRAGGRAEVLYILYRLHKNEDDGLGARHRVRKNLLTHPAQVPN